MNFLGSKINGIDTLSQTAVKNAILTCSWPGRYQIINTDIAKCVFFIGNSFFFSISFVCFFFSFYLDGAHTTESIQICTQWFIQQTKNSPHKKALIFNTTGNRDSTKLLLELYKSNFNIVIFVPNVAKKIVNAGKHLNNSKMYKITPEKLFFKTTKMWLKAMIIN